MKSILVRITLVIALAFNLLCLNSCSEDDPKTTTPGGNGGGEEVIPAVLDLPIVNSVATPTIDPEDTLRITLSEKPRKIKTVDGISYRAVIDQVSISGGYSISTSLSKDTATIKVIPEEVLQGNSNFSVTVTSHWEWKRKDVWETIVWQDVELVESYAGSFSTSAATLALAAEDLEYTYPIANQYHFLIDESNTGFIKLKRANSHIFSSPGHDYKVQFLNDLNLIFERDVTYDNSTKTISFEIPSSLTTKTIYHFRLFSRNTSTFEETNMVDFHFRTSKYRDFTTKFNSIVYTGAVFSILIEPWRGHYLYQIYSSAGEYFDDFEAGAGYVPITIGNNTHQVPYGNNLIRFKASLAGTSWYDDKLYPWLYAPWTDADFKPSVIRSTEFVGNPPVEAMSLYNSGSGRLTPAIIANNSAPEINRDTNSSITFNLPLIIWHDFNLVQQQAVTRYLYQQVVQQREINILYNQMPVISPGTYSYQVKYTLPNGEVTTTLEKSMTYN